MALKYTIEVTESGESLDRGIVTFTEYDTDVASPPFPEEDMTGWHPVRYLDMSGTGAEVRARLVTLKADVVKERTARNSQATRVSQVQTIVDDSLANSDYEI